VGNLERKAVRRRLFVQPVVVGRSKGSTKLLEDTTLACGVFGLLMERTGEGPIRRAREGGSEWEPIKILLEGDENSNKTNTASNTRLRLTTKVGQAHVATGVPLDLGTNTQPSDPRNAAEKPKLESTDPHRSDR
jgi:hypothetical protein